ncbi:MAG: GHKL domain-containing protein [Planctomycetaceae bacterium]|nr:GHKL domain-containing protein [Planctomycetaceae bacterium]
MTHTSNLFETYDPERLDELFHQQRSEVLCRTDRMFAVLMVLQWVGGIIVAIIVSPRTWIGDTSTVHHHVGAAIVLGGFISSLPIVLALTRPGHTITRHVIAVAQMSWSALLIHLSGGRLETHFHIFGSLAFLAFYRDWRVLVTASLVVVVDHFVRGVWWPQSVFGVLMESPFRWMEHAAWVAFEDVFLISSCLRGVRETREMCRRQATLESTNAHIETQIEERTHELREQKERADGVNQELCEKAEQLARTNARLANEIAERARAEEMRAALQEQLIESSRMAGMAEIATGVLHNVGNVLNSVNVSASLLVEQSRTSDIPTLLRASDVIVQHREQISEFLTTDAQGRHFPHLLSELAKSLSGQQERQISELQGLISHIEHIKEIVNMQQSYAHLRGSREPVSIIGLLDDALKINDAGLCRHGVRVTRRFEDVPTIIADKHKILQILVNLISNAKYALDGVDRDDKELMLVLTAGEDHVAVQIHDNGVGIPRENLTKIFAHGFTTRNDGHGFGLHSAALAAQELDGSLSVHSDGPGRGAVFTLRLPRKGDP